MLRDGRYDVLVVEAEPRADGRLACELTIVAGPHKGDVVTVLADLAVDPIELLAVPGTLVVVDGEPRLSLEP